MPLPKLTRRFTAGAHTCECHLGWEEPPWEADTSGLCTDMDECSSDPCSNGGVCTESDCPPGELGKDCGLKTSAPPLGQYACICAEGWAGGLCVGDWDADPRMDESYGQLCMMAIGGQCNVDINECVSAPCANGAACTDSNGGEVSTGAFSCACVAGFADGACAYDVIDQYAAECEVLEGGTCEVDVDECASSPCANGAQCMESVLGASGVEGLSLYVPADAYRCACTAGFANGICAYEFIAEYAAVCALPGGNCDVDVDECASFPCWHGGECAESGTDAVAPDAYRCDCTKNWYGANCAEQGPPAGAENCAGEMVVVGAGEAYTCVCRAGYTGGDCLYSFIMEASESCTKDLFGSCTEDVDECASGPCQNGALCTESNGGGTVPVNLYRCRCADGFTGVSCQDEADECASVPCKNGGICVDGKGDYTCLCIQPGWGGANCAGDVNECAGDPCANGAICMDSTTSDAVGIAGSVCTCPRGFAGPTCARDIFECASTPCAHGGVCSESNTDE